jgi:hypothetical protein
MVTERSEGSLYPQHAIAQQINNVMAVASQDLIKLCMDPTGTRIMRINAGLRSSIKTNTIEEIFRHHPRN